MTTLTHTDWLARGIIASMLVPESALIETIDVEGKQISVAFVDGMPMPYETFAMLMLFRMAPNSVTAIFHNQGTPPASSHTNTMPAVHANRLQSLIKHDHRLPAGHRVNSVLGYGHAAWEAVKALYDRVAFGSADNQSAHEEFSAMMARIEESYASSLLDPQPISAEAFDFNDDRLIADQF